MNHSDNCIFCKIAAGAIPSRKVYEDDELFAFHDVGLLAAVAAQRDREESEDYKCSRSHGRVIRAGQPRTPAQCA